MSSGLAAKIAVLFLGVAMVSEVVDLQSLPSIGIIGSACLFAYKTVSKAKDERVVEYGLIAETLREELDRVNGEKDQLRDELQLVREELKQLREALTLATTADEQDDEE